MEYIDYRRILNDVHSYAKRHLLNTDIFSSENHDRNIKLIRECINSHPYFNGKKSTKGLIDIYYRTSVYKNTLDDVANKLNISYDHAKKLRKSIIRNLTTLIELDIADVKDLISIDDTRLFNILVKSGYIKNSDLNGIGFKDFSNINNFGERSWFKLKEYMDEHEIPYKKDDIGIEEIDILKDLIRNNIDKNINLNSNNMDVKSLILTYLKNTYIELSNSISFNLYTNEHDQNYINIINSISNSLIDIEFIKDFYNISDSMIKDHYKTEVSKRKSKLEDFIRTIEEKEYKEKDKKNKKKKGKKKK